MSRAISQGMTKTTKTAKRTTKRIKTWHPTAKDNADLAELVAKAIAKLEADRWGNGGNLYLS